MKDMSWTGAGCRAACFAMMLAGIVACGRDAPEPDGNGAPAPASQAPAPSAPAADPAPVELEDVSEATADYIIGITYPQSASQYPELAAQLKRYADEARGELMEAVQARRQREPAGEGTEGATMYDLSLAFTEVLDSPDLVAYAADGSMYTGGAHGIPLLARFVWLPRQDRRLTADALVTAPDGWDAIAGYVREQLHTALSQRADGDGLTPAERSDLVRSAGRMIDEGTGPDPENFSQFEPVVDDAGRVTGLRFVFAPYQVGPYSDGTQTVEVPAAVLLPHVAPEYRDLFHVVAPAPAEPVAAPANPRGSIEDTTHG
jgi:hypothetical protein